jgi:hypothetical protein
MKAVIVAQERGIRLPRFKESKGTGDMIKLPAVIPIASFCLRSPQSSLFPSAGRRSGQQQTPLDTSQFLKRFE